MSAPVSRRKFLRGLAGAAAAGAGTLSYAHWGEPRWNERWLYITRGVGNLHGCVSTAARK